MGSKMISGGGITPTKPKNVVKYQTASDSTYYTLLDITGKGIMNRVTLYDESNSVYVDKLFIKVTIDGGTALIINPVDTSTVNAQKMVASSNNFVNYLPEVNFKTSLKIEFQHTAGVNKNLSACCDYSIV